MGEFFAAPGGRLPIPLHNFVVRPLKVVLIRIHPPMPNSHIPVAIKVLRYPLDDMDPNMQLDFDREVKFMRSIRHPHILIFYGAGVDSSSRAFLVPRTPNAVPLQLCSTLADCR